MNNLNLKNILKSLKLNESTISTVIGAIVVIVLGITVMNYFKSSKPDVTIVPGATTENGQPKIVSGSGSVEYTVALNESLWDIAEVQYGSGYNWVDIAEANNLVNPDLLAEGQVLTIPDVESKLSTVGNEEVVEAISGATYTVEEGDSLWNIAIRAYGDGYKWVDIANDNSLDNPDIIHVGNTLTLPR